MGKKGSSRRLTGPKRKKKMRIASPAVEIPPFEYSGFDAPTGLKNIARLLKTASPENNILCECKIIYECKTCREMFRDPNEFTDHKFGDCKERQFVIKSGPLTRSRARTSDTSTSDKLISDNKY
uniref:Uncharacterized protein n=1 Tax=Rhodnius prolixus TaxID=13249 RepID=T1HN41_RHOPR